MVSMTRSIEFSAGHRYWFANRSDAENRELFGEWASPFTHGHNYRVDVTVSGPVNPTTGMLVNIKRLDDLLKERILNVAGQRSLNDEIEFFRTQPPSLENMLRWVRDSLGLQGTDSFQLPETPGGEPATSVRWERIHIQELPTLYAEITPMTAPQITRQYEFAASHRLHSPALSDEENRAVYGKCNNPAGHGHNYVLEVTTEGSIDPVTGFSVHLSELDEAVERLVVDRYDHKNLDVDVPELKGRVTTSEVVAQTIFDQLEGRIPGQLVRIRLWETARNAFEVTRD